MNEVLITILSTVVTAVILPLITLAGNALIKWLAQKTKNEKLAAYLTAASEAVLCAVKATMQTYVDSLKKSGKFTAEAAAQAFQKAKEAATAAISDEVKNFIAENCGGDFNKWLETQIEAAIGSIKSGG